MNRRVLCLGCVLKKYRTLQLINKMSDDGFGELLLSTLVGVFLLIVVGIFLLVSFSYLLDTVSIGIVLMFTIFATLFVTFAFLVLSRVNILSKEVLMQMSRTNSNRLIRRRIQACPTLRVNAGAFFPIKPSTIFTFDSMIINYVLTLILSFRA